MSRVVIVTAGGPGRTAAQAALLTASIREFGGRMSEADVLVMVPSVGGPLSGDERERLGLLGAEAIGFAAGSPALPFTRKVAACAAAEERLHSAPHLLAWLDPDTVVLGEPAALELPEGVMLGYRPVHHPNIAPGWDEPLDEYWAAIYAACGVPGDAITETTTSTGERIRPYLNAGHFVVRAGRGLMAAWADSFARLAADPVLAAHHRSSERHALFFHQAVFTGVLMARLSPEARADLGPAYNYPLHLHDEVPPRLRPKRLDDLITVRTEDLLASADPCERVPLLAPMADWLEPHLASISRA